MRWAGKPSLAKILGCADPGVDRSAVPMEEYACDLCGNVIAGGIHGWELFATCAIETGDCQFDVCASCCATHGSVDLNAEAAPHGYSLEKDSKPNGTKFVEMDSVHRHRLKIVDRGAECAWANEGALATDN